MSEPVIIALLLADKVITENNGKKGLIGVFSKFLFPKFPIVSPPWFIYASVTNLRGHHDMSFNLVQTDSQAVIFSIGGSIDAKDPNAVIEIVFPVINVRFPREGNYILQFNIDGRQVSSRNIQVELISEGKQN